MSSRLSWISVAGLCLLAAACSGPRSAGRGGDDPDGGSDVGSGGGGGDSNAPSCALPSGLSATPSAFALPASRCGVPFDSAARQVSSLSYGLLDLASGDRPDLVVFQDGCDATVGNSHWDVYSSSESGFSAAPASFALPAARCNQPFDEAARFTGSLSYQTLDLLSPAHPDLVVTSDSCDPAVGQSHWDVYPWSASGFAPTPVAFSVPAARCNAPFDETASYSGGTSYSTTALVSKQPDLVVTSDGCDASVGSTHWDVYRWSASGFAAAPASFALPAPRCNTTFDRIAEAGAVDYALTDLTSKGHPGLVVTRDDCDSSVGATHWDLYPWSPSGFSTSPDSFAVPAARCGVSFDALARDASGLSYAVIDLASSGEPALVVFRDDCDPTVGATHWDVYPASSSGFAAQPIPFALPAARCNSSFDSSARSSSSLSYFTSDLATACGPELVVTSDGCDSTVGQSHWDVYQPLKQ